MPSPSSSVSALLPVPSPSVSIVSVESNEKASSVSITPSPSSSVSVLLPVPSPSVSVVSLASLGNASLLSPVPSPSVSVVSLASLGKVSLLSGTPSPSLSRATVIVNEAKLAFKLPSDTVITIPELVPTSALLGVPLNSPVVVLNVAQLGRLVMLYVSVVPASSSDAVGVNE